MNMIERLLGFVLLGRFRGGLGFTNLNSIQASLLLFLFAASIVVGEDKGSNSIDLKNENAGMFDQFITFSENGGWCWFQDERAIVGDGKLLIGSVTSNLTGSDRGDINLDVYDFETNAVELVKLHEGLQRNDHNAPAFLRRPDGRYLAVYAKHHTEQLIRYRVSRAPGDATNWESERTVDTSQRATYSNVYHLNNEGRTYNFYREGERTRTPHYIFSEDEGSTWMRGGQLLGSENSGHWPYIRYTSNDMDEIHFVTTDAHPNQFEETNLYHGFIKGGKIYRSDGVVVGDLSTGEDAEVRPSDLTLIYDGDADNIPWPSDIRLDDEGCPYVSYSVTRDRDGYDHRYRYARWNGSEWQDSEIAYAGSMLYPVQNFYTGLITLHPDTPNVVFISTDVNPETGEPITDGEDRRYEIFVGVTSDASASWSWRPLTRNSTRDNIRPIVASDGIDWALLWMRGTYATYRNFDTQVVGVVSRTSLREREEVGRKEEIVGQEAAESGS